MGPARREGPQEGGATLEGTQSHDREAGAPIEPLTRRNAAGVVYRREPVVERQIAEALRLPPDRLRERAAVSDQHAPDYLKEECLVYLLRRYQRAGERRLVSDLAEALLRRCANLINARLCSLDAGDGYYDVVERLFGQILDLDSDRGDFLQVRFWPALDKLAVRAFNQQLTQRKRAQVTVPLSSLAGYDRDDGDEPGQVARPRDLAAIAAPSGEAAVLADDLIRDALSRVDEPFRSAFLLRHYFDWPIEDQDPAVRTISRHFGKDPRTIRNWLKKADEALQAWRGEQ